MAAFFSGVPYQGLDRPPVRKALTAAVLLLLCLRWWWAAAPRRRHGRPSDAIAGGGQTIADDGGDGGVAQFWRAAKEGLEEQSREQLIRSVLRYWTHGGLARVWARWCAWMYHAPPVMTTSPETSPHVRVKLG